MKTNKSHEDLMQDVAEEYKDILSNSGQAVYIYLDNTHKICNENFAALVGYESAEEWSQLEDPLVNIEEKSQKVLVDAYTNAMEKEIGSVNKITFLKKDGKRVNANIILVPISFAGHLMALHYVTKA